MNRRTFLSAMAATSLTPIMPAQIFASGGIYPGIDTVCMARGMTHVGRNVKFEYRASDDDEWQEISPIHPISVFAAAVYGDGTDWHGGLIA